MTGPNLEVKGGDIADADASYQTADVDVYYETATRQMVIIRDDNSNNEANHPYLPSEIKERLKKWRGN